MTTIPTHNIIMQQSVAAHDATHQNKPLQPDPGQVVAQQIVEEVIQNTTVQKSEAYEKLKADRAAAKLKALQEKKKKKKKKQLKRGQDPEAPGNLLDTVV